MLSFSFRMQCGWLVLASTSPVKYFVLWDFIEPLRKDTMGLNVQSLSRLWDGPLCQLRYMVAKMQSRVSLSCISHLDCSSMWLTVVSASRSPLLVTQSRPFKFWPFLARLGLTLGKKRAIGGIYGFFRFSRMLSNALMFWHVSGELPFEFWYEPPHSLITMNPVEVLLREQGPPSTSIGDEFCPATSPRSADREHHPTQPCWWTRKENGIGDGIFCRNSGSRQREWNREYERDSWRSRKRGWGLDMYYEFPWKMGYTGRTWRYKNEPKGLGLREKKEVTSSILERLLDFGI